MVEYLGLIQLAGKYVFLAALYVFVIWIFRSLFATLQVEQAAETGQRRRRPQTTEAPPQRVQSQPVQRPRRAPRTQARSRPASSAKPRPRLVVTDAGQSELKPGREFPLTAAVTLGRADENSIQISDRYASSQHALIFLKDDRRILRDRNSTNGTTRNGAPVSGDVVLNDGDIIGIGTSRLKYVSGQ
jgi:pSer/pThr/pTyr-binding forkhead associated (FHA) protein